MKNIKVTGARTHNLKNISVEIPKEKITVISGLSGSGKSSLAFDTIYAEGQRRYIENLSSYARQIIGTIEKPDVDSIEGIPPAISIDQKSVVRSPRSTVGTITEIYDYLRVLYSRFGHVHCPNCSKRIYFGDNSVVISQAIEYIKTLPAGHLDVVAPIVKDVKGQNKSILTKLSRSKWEKFVIDDKSYKREELEKLSLNKSEAHTIQAIIFSGKIESKITDPFIAKMVKSVSDALDLSEGVVYIESGEKSKIFSRRPFCQECNLHFPVIQPRLFSFNSPYGACHRCQGLGVVKEVQGGLVIPNKKLTLDEGAIRPWARLAGQNGNLMKSLKSMGEKYNFQLDIPVEQLSKEAIQVILKGDEEFEGVVANLEKKYHETDSDYLRQEIEQYMVEKKCAVCNGTRLNQTAKSVLVGGKNIVELSNMELTELYEFLSKAEVTTGSQSLVFELKRKIKNIIDVGLGYLTLMRSSETLSGGEAQRIRLGVQFDSFLSGVLYVLDEPTISLHASDTEKLIEAFDKLKNEGNTLIVVEHDKAVVEAADYVFDIGPGAGKEGGEVIAQGTPEQIIKDKNSITGQYLSGNKKIYSPKKIRKPNSHYLKVIGATENNLKNITTEIPLGLFVAVSGVSGSGKSTLVYDVIAKALSMKLHRSQEEPGKYEKIEGIENIDKVIKIDQTPIGRTPRSNLATYTGLFTPIREILADTPEAITRNYQASNFSFNLKGGRCENCRGDGMIKIEMYFMPDVYVTCEECNGKRYNSETLEIKYKEKSVADILSMSVEEASEFFFDNEEISEKLNILKKVGLGYLPLGQSATTLSGGEAQRIKLATELSRPSTGKTMYILDEPTTGLHFEDVNKLLSVLHELVDRGNTVLTIEHNLDVIKSADYVIDMGPQGGSKGGEIIAQGTPREVAKNKKSITGLFLAKEL